MRIPTILLVSGIPAIAIATVAIAIWLIILMALTSHAMNYLYIALLVLLVAVLAKKLR